MPPSCRAPKPSTRVSWSSLQRWTRRRMPSTGIGEVRGEVAGVDGADARPAEDVDLRRSAAHAREVVEDVPEDADLVGAARAAAGEDHRRATLLAAVIETSPWVIARRPRDRVAASAVLSKSVVTRGRSEKRRFEARVADRAHERGGVVDGALPRGGRLRRGRALQRIGAEHADFEAVLAALERLDGAERGRREERRRVDLARVDARRGLDRHRVEVIRDERLLLGAAPRRERRWRSPSARRDGSARARRRRSPRA